MGSVFGICTFVFGAINNGGHFNPAITVAVLMQRFDPSQHGSLRFYKMMENVKFAFKLILSQLIGMTLGIIMMKFTFFAPS
jgi:glycerol uptake facilitator-like aquaporin